METAIILILLLALVVIVIFTILLLIKKESVVGIFSLDKNLPRTSDAPVKINITMYDKKNRKLKMNVDGKDYILSTFEIDKDEYKGVVLNSEKFTEQAQTVAGQDDIQILISDDLLFYGNNPSGNQDINDKDFKFSKCGYYTKNKDSKIINLNGTYQNKDDKSGLIINMKNPVVIDRLSPVTFSFDIKNNDGTTQPGGPFTGGIIGYSPLSPLSLKDSKVPDQNKYTLLGFLKTSVDAVSTILVSGDLNNILYLNIDKDDKILDFKIFTKQ